MIGRLVEEEALGSQSHPLPQRTTHPTTPHPQDADIPDLTVPEPTPMQGWNEMDWEAPTPQARDAEMLDQTEVETFNPRRVREQQLLASLDRRAAEEIPQALVFNLRVATDSLPIRRWS